MRTRLAAGLFALALACASAAVAAMPNTATVAVAYLAQRRELARPPSLLDQQSEDEGVQGARLGIADDNATGRFIGQTFVLAEAGIETDAEAANAIGEIAGRGIRLVVADLPPTALLAAADAARSDGVLLLNVGATDDVLRNESCRQNVLHVAPSRAMLADALAQYLVARNWRRWFLVVGRAPGDGLFAAAVRRSASRFGGRIVDEKPWTFQPGNRRADTGHVALQTEIPAFTRIDADYDVLVVADEADEFGEYLPDRTALPRPVAGTQGLVPTAWTPVHKQWGAMQLQDRFRRQAGRAMTARDYLAWLAVRTVGEAALRAHRGTRADRAIHGQEDFVVAGFKGQGLSFRRWDGQLRQPILLANAKLLVSVSPQSGFLHPTSELDTLGYDLPETRCRTS